MVPVTMTAVAKKARVGIGTVSRVVNNSARVSEHTRQRVLEAINELGYRQTRIARALVHKGAYAPTVGVLCPLFSLPSHHLLLLGAHKAAIARGYHLLLTSPPPGADLAGALERAIRQFHVDGMLLMADITSGGAPVRDVIGPMMPAVSVDRSANEICSVCADTRRGGRLAGEHLWRRGCRRPAVVALPKHPARHAAFAEFFNEHGVSDVQDRTIEIGEFTEKEGYDLTDRLLAGNPDGFFFCSDLLALGGLTRLREAGANLPVIGYDNLDFAEPVGLTTVDHQYENMGRTAFEILAQQIEGHRSIDPKHVEHRALTPQLIVRKT